MSSINSACTIDFSPTDNLKIANLCGPSNENIKHIEAFFDVSIANRSSDFTIRGSNEKLVNNVKNILTHLYQQADKSIEIEAIQSMMTHTPQQAVIALRHRQIQLKNERQKQYINHVDLADIVFSVGPAGTGKTYLAVAKACEQLEKGNVDRLVFVRPAVEAGEKLGFLPGDLVDKVLPYLRPVYDALYDMLGFKEAQKLIKSDIIEILPLAFMRGRTLNDSFIILDEAQNTTILQMKMFLTRIGFGSKAIITGDITQTDLPNNTRSGLSHALALFKQHQGIKISRFTTKEVVRHPLVSKIIQAYERDASGQS